MTELTANRTLALRQALGDHPQVAFLAALHALTLRGFYQYGTETCLELELKQPSSLVNGSSPGSPRACRRWANDTGSVVFAPNCGH